jgi:5-methylcytosine-specific restriction enzyme subunit McrC
MEILTLFEYGEIDWDWAERDLVAIERLNRASGAEVLHAAMRGARRTLQARQYVGVVRLGRTTVQILPKIYQAKVQDDRAHARSATHNLLHMLAYADQLQLREQEMAPLLQRELDWFEILTHLFAMHLAEEWQRGAHRGYQDVEAELPLLKGKWRVGEQLRRPGQNHRLAVAYAEFGADDALNRVFRYVVEQLWRLTRDDDNRRKLADLRLWMDEVTLLPVLTAADARPGLITRLNRRYEPLLNLARIFLGQSTLQLAAGEVNAFGLVFDMNLLFQEFIANFIARHRSEILPPDLQACELLPQSHGAVQHLARRKTGGDAVFPLYPDLAFRAGDEFPVLLDTKYKQLDPVGRGLGVASDDFYQMFSYAHRYHCPRVILIYPQADGDGIPIRQSFDVQGMQGVIDVATVNLQVDMRAERRRLIAELKAILGHD